MSVLAGIPGPDQSDPGATICACFAVGVNTIADAIATKGLMTVDKLVAALRAGTNCGYCRPELRALIARLAVPILEAAE